MIIVKEKLQETKESEIISCVRNSAYNGNKFAEFVYSSDKLKMIFLAV